mmetsp:Transcript_38508/g.107318  ORF Transcript_38508/g.107318 Transcript_38508/m.107318 type:complete len:333 (-) Transcript_38508:148-1146(-)
MVAAGKKPLQCRRRHLFRAARGALRVSAVCSMLLALRGTPTAWLQASGRGCSHHPAGAAALTAGCLGKAGGDEFVSVKGVQGRTRRHGATKTSCQALQVNEEEYIEVWDQTIEELALDVRELLITDANLYFIGPDVESYQYAIDEVAAHLNYTAVRFPYKDLLNATASVDALESIYSVPPLVSVQRWPWAVMMHGLVIWVDPDGYEHLNVYDRDRVRKLKFPKKKAAFGPAKAPVLSLNTPSEEPPADPLDMWMEADVHVDLRAHDDLPVTKVMLASIINAILDNPPKWRGWMKQAKIRGTVAADFQTPFEERRRFHSNGVSPRLNRLLAER